jgi:hypothetical protein
VLKKPSRTSDGAAARGFLNKIPSVDFAIAWEPGRHVTIFPLVLLIGAMVLLLVVAALVAVIWFLL